MTAVRVFRGTSANAWRLGLCALAMMIGTAIGGASVSALGMPIPQMPGQADERIMGLLFLAASVPILILWSGSRRQLVPALGLAFHVLVGLFGMIQSYWLAPTLQILHNTEILADSMVYALALAVLLVRRDEAQADEVYARFLLCMTEASVGKQDRGGLA